MPCPTDLVYELLKDKPVLMHNYVLDRLTVFRVRSASVLHYV